MLRTNMVQKIEKKSCFQAVKRNITKIFQIAPCIMLDIS